MSPLANADVTLYMQRKSAGVTTWSRVVLRGVSYRQKSVRTSDGSQGGAGILKFVKQTTLVVDTDVQADTGDESVEGTACSYVPPKAFSLAESVDGLWTLKKGDLVMLGADTGEIASAADLNELQKSEPTLAVIQGVEDATMDAPLPCWKVDAL